MIYNLTSAEIQEANSNAMSRWAKVPPPYLPDFVRKPMALVLLTHFEGVMTNEFLPASFLTASNSTRLKPSLLNISHRPMNSIVSFNLIQFCIGYLGSSLFNSFAMSVKLMKSSSSIPVILISIFLTVILFIKLLSKNCYLVLPERNGKGRHHNEKHRCCQPGSYPQ